MWDNNNGIAPVTMFWFELSDLQIFRISKLTILLNVFILLSLVLQNVQITVRLTSTIQYVVQMTTHIHPYVFYHTLRVSTGTENSQ